MVAGFDFNETLKEKLCLDFGAFEAKSRFFENGVPLIPEPFLETTVRWDKDCEGKKIEMGIKKVLEFKDDMEKRCFVTDVQLETVYGHPQIIWGIFKEEEEIIN